MKPTSYFYPGRDIADGQLASDSVKSRLADTFHDKISLRRKQADQFSRSLELDTKLLAEHNAVDYSMFLVRITSQNQSSRQATKASGTNVMAKELSFDVLASRGPLFRRQTHIPRLDSFAQNTKYDQD